uniref:Small ribosomal subunit protein uS15c n=2 Tax=Genlisea aurea TaxID=192259 RepID=A0A2I6QD95_9LAMI|nr:ribosomal protein S15 [Genlisea aurea]AUN28353.1 ribosomal protein S15 [Genlisea aurea]
MVKNAFSSQKKQTNTNKGSVESQVFGFTTQIRRLSSHLELHKKDSSSQRGLRKILGKRQRLLNYFSKKNKESYNQLIRELASQEFKIS